MLAPTRAASSAMPSARSSTHWAGRSAGAAEADGQRVRRAAHRVDVGEVRPRPGGRCRAAVAHSRRKCRPSTSRSVETTTCPLGVRSTAASSPGPDEDVRALLETAGERRDQAELADVGEGGSGGERAPEGAVMAPSHQIARAIARGPRVSPPAGRPVGCERSRLTEPTRESHMVVQAYILIQTDVGKAAEVAQQITDIKGVILAEDVTGPYDVIVRAEARNVDELGKLVVAKVQTLDGITRTLTCPVVHI